jgi:hypothetical protein
MSQLAKGIGFFCFVQRHWLLGTHLRVNARTDHRRLISPIKVKNVKPAQRRSFLSSGEGKPVGGGRAKRFPDYGADGSARGGAPARAESLW